MTMLNQKNWLAGASKQTQKNIQYFLKLYENLYRRWLSPWQYWKIICLLSCSTLRKDLISHGQYFHVVYLETSLLVYLLADLLSDAKRWLQLLQTCLVLGRGRSLWQIPSDFFFSKKNREYQSLLVPQLRTIAVKKDVHVSVFYNFCCFTVFSRLSN